MSEIDADGKEIRGVVTWLEPDRVEINGVDLTQRIVMVDTLEPIGASACWFQPMRVWDRAHRNPFPALVLFPRVARWQHRARAARERIGETWGVLVHGLPERDEDDW